MLLIGTSVSLQSNDDYEMDSNEIFSIENQIQKGHYLTKDGIHFTIIVVLCYYTVKFCAWHNVCQFRLHKHRLLNLYNVHGVRLMDKHD